MTSLALTAEQHARRTRLGLLARARPERLGALWQAQGLSPAFTWLRAPEIGAVMLRGRAGGTGAAFNLGEMSVTRCAVRLDSGEVGHGWVQGRGKDHATQAALIDALMQTGVAEGLQTHVLDVLAAEADATRRETARKAAATKVEFFTMVRGED